MHNEFDIAKLRHHTIVLMADADIDGQHISTGVCDRGSPRGERIALYGNYPYNWI